MEQSEQSEQILDDSPFENDEQSKAKITNINLILALLIVLIVGIGIGLFVQPLLIKDAPTEVVAMAIPSSNQTIPSANTGDSSPTPTIMETVLSDARHFQGSADAPVTMIEFSDFK